MATVSQQDKPSNPPGSTSAKVSQATSVVKKDQNISNTTKKTVCAKYILEAKMQSYQATIKANDECVRQLREQNLSLSRNLSERKTAEERIFKQPFPNRCSDDIGYRMPGKKAEPTLNNKLDTKTKHLNEMKNTTQRYQQDLDLLWKESQRLKHESDHYPAPHNSHIKEDEERATELRTMEIQIEMTKFKCSQAVFNMRDYQKLKSLIKEESLACKRKSKNLDSLIQNYNMSLPQLQAKNNETLLANKALQIKTQQLEELYNKEEQERKLNLIAHIKKAQAATCKIVLPESEYDDRKIQILNQEVEDINKTIAEVGDATFTLEETLRNNNVEVSDDRKIVGTWVTKREQPSQLEKLKKENDKVLQKLRKQRKLLVSKLEEVDLSNSIKLDSDQQELAEHVQLLQTQQSRCSAAAVELHLHLAKFTTIQEATENLAHKLQHITLSEDTETRASTDSCGLVLELLSNCVQKLQILKDKLKGEDLATIKREMKQYSMEETLPSNSNLIKLPEQQNLDHSDIMEEDC
ncbi:outer dynein arm-docking complex subunit 3-like [Paralichthys olivaceus]|uniref:outer dynein arm-docking complex subunit 3-like n=1 Tax=Paralichthys olivaceus TaxID=8255 RepID=UPI003751DAC5